MFCDRMTKISGSILCIRLCFYIFPKHCIVFICLGCIIDPTSRDVVGIFLEMFRNLEKLVLEGCLFKECIPPEDKNSQYVDLVLNGKNTTHFQFLQKPFTLDVCNPLKKILCGTHKIFTFIRFEMDRLDKS